MKTNYLYEVPDYKKIRVIIDTDAACEADDPFAIVQGLLSPKLTVKGIVAEHFVSEGSMERSLAEIKTILELMDITDIQIVRNLSDNKVSSYTVSLSVQGRKDAVNIVISDWQNFEITKESFFGELQEHRTAAVQNV